MVIKRFCLYQTAMKNFSKKKLSFLSYYAFIAAITFVSFIFFMFRNNHLHLYILRTWCMRNVTQELLINNGETML